MSSARNRRGRSLRFRNLEARDSNVDPKAHAGARAPLSDSALRLRVESDYRKNNVVKLWGKRPRWTIELEEE